MLSLICGLKKIKQMNEYTKTETDSEIQRKRQCLAVGRGAREGARQGQRIKRHKLLYMK